MSLNLFARFDRNAAKNAWQNNRDLFERLLQDVNEGAFKGEGKIVNNVHYVGFYSLNPPVMEDLVALDISWCFMAIAPHSSTTCIIVTEDNRGNCKWNSRIVPLNETAITTGLENLLSLLFA
jgi:hypothetical protein